MYKSIRTIQKEAITALKDRRGIYILMFTLNAAIALTLSATRIAGLVGTLLSVLFQVGMNAFALKLCCGLKQEAQFNDLFFIFGTNRGQIGNAILLYLIQALFILPASIIYAVLVAIFAFAETKAIVTADILTTLSTSVGLAIFVVVTFIAFLIYCIYISITYLFSLFVLLDYPDLNAKDMWMRASRILKGNRLRYIILEFCYILCYIIPVSLLTAGISISEPLLILVGSAFCIATTFWVVPNMQCARAIFYLDLVQRNTKPVEPEIPNMI